MPYTQELADTICERIMAGESLRSICKDETLPCLATVCKWLNIHKEFAEQYTRAREIQAELLADEIIEIADDKSGDISYGDEGQEYENKEFVNRSRLRIDARKWTAAKLLPKKYGDKQEIKHTADQSFIFQLVQPNQNNNATDTE